MDMKRLNIFVQAFLFCTLAFSQHPGSRGGNPLYWALVGGISAGILYVFYLLLGLLVNIIKRLKHRDFHLSEKLNSFLAKKGYEENKSRGEMHCNLPTDGEELREKSNEDNHQGVTLCKGCVKQIQDSELYCSYYRAKQSRKKKK